MGFLLHPPRKMGENFLQGLFFLAFFCYHFYNAMASIHKTAPKSKWRMSKLKINKERRKHFSFLSSCEWPSFLCTLFHIGGAFFNFHFQRSRCRGPQTDFSGFAQPRKPSQPIHTFLMEIYSAYTFFVSMPLPSVSHALLPPARQSPSRKTIRREESFFNSHIHTRSARWFWLPTPPAAPSSFFGSF